MSARLAGASHRIALAALAALVITAPACERPRPPPPLAEAPPPAAPIPPAPVAPAVPDCAAPAYQSAAAINAGSLNGLAWEPYRREEIGWEIYAPVVAKEIATACPPQSPGFAAALARWQASRGLPADGLFNGAAFDIIKGLNQERRPFVMATTAGRCPEPPREGALAFADQDESYGGKRIQLRRGALAAYRQMRDAARREAPGAVSDPQFLVIFSGFRSPVADAARCLLEQNCTGVTRARCSAHRTGLALDINLGAAPGYKPDNSADENRLYMSRTPAYRWLVANAGRFGFVNYVFEPWHWEWTGEPPEIAAGAGTMTLSEVLNDRRRQGEQGNDVQTELGRGARADSGRLRARAGTGAAPQADADADKRPSTGPAAQRPPR